MRRVGGPATLACAWLSLWLFGASIACVDLTRPPVVVPADASDTMAPTDAGADQKTSADADVMAPDVNCTISNVAPDAGANGDSDGGLSSGLVGWWKMDEPVGCGVIEGARAADSSPYGNTLFLKYANGAADFEKGLIGNAYHFKDNGMRDPWWEAPWSTSFNTVKDQVTIAAWYKREDPPDLSTDNANGILWRTADTDGKAWGLLTRSYPNDPVLNWLGHSTEFVKHCDILPNGSWYHLAATYSLVTTTVVLYLNGEAVSSSSTWPLYAPSLDAFPMASVVVGNTYGDQPSNTYYGMSGWLDDVRLYNRVLSAQEIAALYALAGLPPRPVTCR